MLKYLKSTVRGSVFQITDISKHFLPHYTYQKKNWYFWHLVNTYFTGKFVHGILLESNSGNAIGRMNGFFVSLWHGGPLTQRENSPLV